MTNPQTTLGDTEGRSQSWTARHWWTVVMYIAAVAMLLRFYNLPLKPLHHDEGVNTLLLTALVRPPHDYRYDPSNYHGPTLYYAAWLSTALYDSPTFAIRFVTGVAGLLSVLLMLTLRRSLGGCGALAAAALLAVSPGSVYFSRYFIHETLLVCCTIALVAAATRWVDSQRRGLFHLAAVSAGLMFATKETAVITAVVLSAAAIGAAWLVPDSSAARFDGQTVSRWRLASVFSAMQSCLDPHRQGRRQAVAWLLALGLFAAVAFAFYSSFFTHPAGALDAARALAPWMRVGTSAHRHPWFTYLVWLWQEEFPLLACGFAGAVAAFWKADRRFAVFAGLWAVGMLTAYSTIPYKTPWLTLNILTPFAITAGYAVELALRDRATVRRSVLAAAVSVLLMLATYQAVVLNFFRYDDERYPYVYVHTDRQLLDLVARIDRLRAENGPLTIAVTSESHFPLSWYLRDYAVGYYGHPIETDRALVIGSKRQQVTLDRSLGDRYVTVGSYRLRPGVELVLYAHHELKGLGSATADRATAR
jgi:uncharacterized protein (TIGR03663 family)